MIDKINTEEFETAIESEKPVLIDFWADWCSPCKMVEPELEAVKESRSDVDILKMNTDDNMGVSAAYNVRSIPTFMIFQHGEEVSRLTGAVRRQELNSWIDSAMQLTK